MTDVIHVDEQNFLPTLKTVILKQRSKKRAGIKREKRKQREEVETEGSVDACSAVIRLTS